MFKIVAILLWFVTGSFGRDCIKYGAPATLIGTLFLKDEAGYNQFVAFRPSPAICTVADSKDIKDPIDPYYRKQRSIREIQANVFGDDPVSAALSERLKRMVGYRVSIKGELFPATTGFDRTSVMLRTEAVDPVDSPGRRALLLPKVDVKIKDVDAYDLTIHAGKRLVIEARESGLLIPLLPADRYVKHWMTSLEVLYVDCRDGYERRLISNTAGDYGICFDNDGLCGLTAFPKKPVILKLQCTKKR